MTTITITLRNVDEATAQNVANFVLRKLEAEGMASQIVSADIQETEEQPQT